MLAEKRLPLFPLGTVLFPRMMLPLRIFEPRYRQMLDDCLNGDETFGVLLIKEGPEVGGPAVPYEIGTTARILSVEKKAEGVINITTRGQERFRLRHTLHDQPYLVGEVEPYPLADTDASEVPALARRGTALLAAYMELLSRAAGAEIRLQRVPTDPQTIAYLTAMLLQVTEPAKQRLLSIAGLPTLFREEAALLENERKVLTVMIHALETSGLPEDTNLPFSKN